MCAGELRRWAHGHYTLVHDTQATEFALDLLFFCGCEGEWRRGLPHVAYRVCPDVPLPCPAERGSVAVTATALLAPPSVPDARGRGRGLSAGLARWSQEVAPGQGERWRLPGLRLWAGRRVGGQNPPRSVLVHPFPQQNDRGASRAQSRDFGGSLGDCGWWLVR